jgi:prepilin-type N-terminal cleavage/methylation domain-containing protein
MRRAFTMIELIFVIVIVGILAKFGVEFLIKAYDAYIFSSIQNKLQTQTEVTLEQIANRLQYRIKSSIIARFDNNIDSNFTTNYKSLSNAVGTETILEWIGYDIDGMRGTTAPTWSGFIDLVGSTSSNLFSPETNTTDINNTIASLSNGAVGIAQSALYFIGGNSDISKFGWDGGPPITDNSHSIHPINAGLDTAHLAITDMSGQDAYEFYQLAWSAYALVWRSGNSSSIGYAGSLDDNVSATLFGNVLPTAISSGTQNGEWRRVSANNYVVKIDNIDIAFTYNPNNGTFTCNPSAPTTGAICKRLTY